jgi:hypothetical protein
MFRKLKTSTKRKRLRKFRPGHAAHKKCHSLLPYLIGSSLFGMDSPVRLTLLSTAPHIKARIEGFNNALSVCISAESDDDTAYAELNVNVTWQGECLDTLLSLEAAPEASLEVTDAACAARNRLLSIPIYAPFGRAKSSYSSPIGQRKSCYLHAPWYYGAPPTAVVLGQHWRVTLIRPGATKKAWSRYCHYASTVTAHNKRFFWPVRGNSFKSPPNASPISP